MPSTGRDYWDTSRTDYGDGLSRIARFRVHIENDGPRVIWHINKVKAAGSKVGYHISYKKRDAYRRKIYSSQ